MPFLRGLRVLPIDIQSIEADGFEDFHGAGGKSLAPLRSRCGCSKIGGVGPTADAEKDFKMTMLLLQKVKLLETAVDVSPNIVPGVFLIVLVCVRPRVGQEAANI